MKNNPVSARHIGAIAALTMLLLALHYSGILSPIERGLQRVTSPMIGGISKTARSVGSVSTYFAQKKELSAELDTVKQKNIDLQQKAASAELLQQENQELREQLKFQSKTNYKTVVATVVGKTIDNTSNAVIINRGEQDGVTKGSAVVVSEGVLAGVIAKVDRASAVVRLINDSQSSVAASVLSSDKSIGIVQGGFGIGIKLTTVLQEEELNNGDLVISSGLQTHIPRGLLIGTISSVQKEDYAPFQEAALTPTADLSRLSTVAVLSLEL